MIRLIAASLLVLAWQTIPAVAETCDAGHGCSITCKDGCSAIYNLDTHRCSKACGRASSAAAAPESKVNANFHDMPASQIDKILSGVK